MNKPFAVEGLANDPTRWMTIHTKGKQSTIFQNIDYGIEDGPSPPSKITIPPLPRSSHLSLHLRHLPDRAHRYSIRRTQIDLPTPPRTVYLLVLPSKHDYPPVPIDSDLQPGPPTQHTHPDILHQMTDYIAASLVAGGEWNLVDVGNWDMGMVVFDPFLTAVVDGLSGMEGCPALLREIFNPTQQKWSLIGRTLVQSLGRLGVAGKEAGRLIKNVKSVSIKEYREIVGEESWELIVG